MNYPDAIGGCVLGTAVGDALGLPCEGLSREKQRRYFGTISDYRLLFGRGLYSDDAEHTILVAQALIVSNGESEAFLNAFARQLRGWILMLPGGTGLATLKASWKLVFGVAPQRSGVFSAGNGPAMRAAILGVFCAAHDDEITQLIALNRASSRVTHTDPKAECGALAIALAAYFTATEKTIEPRDFLNLLRTHLPADDAARELLLLLDQVVKSVENGRSTDEFVRSMGWKGASGYIYHTVPAALHAWLRHSENYREGVLEIIGCGGDTDSTAAIVGGLIGARVGREGIPREWRAGLYEWPRGVEWLEKLADRLAHVCATRQPQKPLPTFWPGVPARNFFFLRWFWLMACAAFFHFKTPIADGDLYWESAFVSIRSAGFHEKDN